MRCLAALAVVWCIAFLATALICLLGSIQMIDINTGGSAFPLAGAFGMHEPEWGMTLRDYFAAAAIQGTLPGRLLDPDEYAQLAYRMADAMLRARGE